MICPDCEQEVDKLTTKGVCKQCATRINQLNYLNKRDGTNKPYVPIKDLKYKDPGVYKRIMERRASKGKNAQPTKVKEIKKIEPKEVKSTNIKEQYYSKVAKDIEKMFKKTSLNQEYLNHKRLDVWLETFYSLLQDDNFILDAKRGEQIFNDLYILYKHSQEELDWDDIEQIQELGFAQKALSELRRPTKEILDFYAAISPVVDYLKKDTKFMDLISNCREEMIKKANNHLDPKYYTNIDSVIANTDNIVVSDDFTKSLKLWYVEVPCYNLFGNKGLDTFKTNRGILAKTESEARLKFKAFLADKFSNVTYQDKNIIVKQVANQREIDDLIAGKDCL